MQDCAAASKSEMKSEIFIQTKTLSSECWKIYRSRYGHCSDRNILVLNVVANFYTNFYNLDKLSSFCSILSN